jgi:Na+-transporting NADH:ubiquinone oxidoreductase subunit C
MNRQGIVYTILITFAISFVFLAVLSVTYIGSKTRIDRNEELKERRTVLNAFDLKVTGTEEDYENYESQITVSTVGDDRIYRTQTGGEIRHGILFSGAGLWGTITGVLAVNRDASRVVGLDIVSHNETPGLGGRIDESWFKEQFRGESLPEEGIGVTRGGMGDPDHDNGRVDAITGATRTSDALEDMLNIAITGLRTALGLE